MKLITLGASTSNKSINKQLAAYTASLLQGAEVEVLDLNDFDLPLFSEDQEAKLGQPQAAKDFFAKIGSADGLIISYAEHNGSYTAAYKNLFDWASRIGKKVFQNKPAVFLATSPGPGGAGSVLKQAQTSASFFGANLKAAVSVPSFYDRFDVATQTMRDPDWEEHLRQAVHLLQET